LFDLNKFLLVFIFNGFVTSKSGLYCEYESVPAMNNAGVQHYPLCPHLISSVLSMFDHVSVNVTACCHWSST